MESCLSVEREHEKVANKLDVVRGSSLSRLQAVIDQVESLKERIRQGDCMLPQPQRMKQISNFLFAQRLVTAFWVLLSMTL